MEKAHIPWYKSYGFSLVVAGITNFTNLGLFIVINVYQFKYFEKLSGGDNLWYLLLSCVIFLALMAVSVYCGWWMIHWTEHVQQREINAGKNVERHLWEREYMRQRRVEDRRKGFFIPRGPYE